MLRPGIVRCCAMCMYLLAGCRTEQTTQDVFSELERVREKGELVDLPKFYTDSVIIEEAGMIVVHDKSTLLHWESWNQGLRRRWWYDRLMVRDGELVLYNVKESSAWLSLMGFSDLPLRDSMTVSFQGNRIARVNIPSPRDSAMLSLERVMAPFLAWTQTTPKRRHSVQFIMPGWFRFRRSELTARTWMRLAISWRVHLLTGFPF